MDGVARSRQHASRDLEGHAGLCLTGDSLRSNPHCPGLADAAAVTARPRLMVTEGLCRSRRRHPGQRRRRAMTSAAMLRVWPMPGRTPRRTRGTSFPLCSLCGAGAYAWRRSDKYLDSHYADLSLLPARLLSPLAADSSSKRHFAGQPCSLFSHTRPPSSPRSAHNRLCCLLTLLLSLTRSSSSDTSLSSHPLISCTSFFSSLPTQCTAAANRATSPTPTARQQAIAG